MQLTLLKTKLHGAIITGADLHYEGSITIASELCRLARLQEFEKEEIYNTLNGACFATYVIRCSVRGQIAVNGAAARLVQRGDRVIIAAYAGFTPVEAEQHRLAIVLLDDRNRGHIKS